MANKLIIPFQSPNVSDVKFSQELLSPQQLVNAANTEPSKLSNGQEAFLDGADCQVRPPVARMWCFSGNESARTERTS
jgi:hypothetical protein